MADTAKLILGNDTFELPVIEGTEKEKAIDITKLRANSGYITIDSGYANTGSCTSDITFLNGEEGILKHRGITIEDLCAKSNFLEVSYMLYHGTLPTTSELESFSKQIQDNSTLNQNVINIIKQFPKDAHPMGAIGSAMMSLSGFYHQHTNENLSQDQKDIMLPLLMGQMKAIATTFYRHSQGRDLKNSSDTNYCSDFLNMMFDGDVDSEISNALDVLLILHADHEQNCSASTVRMIGSSKANLFATIAGGVAALWGPLHGGANQAVLEMLDAIHKDGGGYKKFLDKAKDKEDPFRLMGFGHRVYKNFDPRARIIKKYCDTVLSKLGVDDPLLEIAKGLEEAALNDDYFAERKLYPNVDFYSGIIYRALGIPTNMFTGMFAIGRLPGWLSQWKEMIESDAFRICRPRQVFTGETSVTYTDIGNR